jgi:hypothetical protein
VTWEIILRDFWGAVLRDCTNVLASAVSAFAQIPVPEALAIAGSADEHQRLHLDQSGFWIEAWTDCRGELHREFLAKVKPDLVAARDEVYTELTRETVQQEIQQQQQQQQRSIRRC